MVSIEELAKKSPKECWSKVNYMWHYLGLYVARPLLKTSITPNQITIFWIFLELISAAFMLGGYGFRIAGIIIFNFIVNLLDYTDGNIARIKNIKTYSGVYLEYVGLFLGMPVFLLFIGIGEYVRTGNSLALLLGFLCSLFLVYEKLFNVNAIWFPPEKWEKLRKVYRSSSLFTKNIFSYLSELFRKAQPFNILFFGIIFDYLTLTLGIYAVIGFFAMLKKMYTQFRTLKRMD